MSTTREQVEQQRRRLAEMEADLTDEGGDPIEDARKGASEGDGFDLHAAIQNAESAEEVQNLIREHGSEHGVRLAGDLGDTPKPKELDAEAQAEYERALFGAKNEAEAIQVIEQFRGYDPRVTQ